MLCYTDFIYNIVTIESYWISNQKWQELHIKNQLFSICNQTKHCLAKLIHAHGGVAPGGIASSSQLGGGAQQLIRTHLYGE